MDPILEWGLEVIVAIQTIRSPALDAFFRGVTFLGDAEFYLLLAPIIIWCVNYRLGARLGILLLLSSSINAAFKNTFMQPRPCEPRPEICIDQAEGYGIPSGHAQNAIVFWGVIAHWVEKSWAWATAILLMLLIGLSRIYLGVHFPTDVFAGWAIGIVILGTYVALGKRTETWLGGLSLPAQVLVATAVPLLLLALQPNDVMVQVTGAFAGIAVGVALGVWYLDFDAGGPLWQRAVRFVLGVALVAAIYFGLRFIFPGEGESLYAVFRFIRYGLVGLWISLGAPWLFLRLGLADTKQTSA
ncbi:MAG: phosphatase PAP2 family protein [Anaerolineae bacterium]|nr:MAG: phosphatase PAP2 family protein [Anaerolineae bacterium]